MLKEAEKNLASIRNRFRFEQMDAQEISYLDDSFDILIANHMLYHVPDQSQAIREFRRVLKANGRVFASTNGMKHTTEINDLVKRYGKQLSRFSGNESVFTLDGGHQVFSEAFANVEVRRWENALAVTEVEPLVDYVASMDQLTDEELHDCREFITAEMADNGVFRVTIDVGMFIAQ